MVYDQRFPGNSNTIVKNYFLLVFISLLIFPYPSYSKDQKESGSLKGTFWSWDHKFTPGIEVILTGKNLKDPRKAITNAQGIYKIDNLPAGENYRVIFDKQGFHEVTKSGIIIEPGKETTLNISFGRWAKVRDEHSEILTEEQKRKIEKLKSIGYLAGCKGASEKKNVTTYDRKSAYKGLNFYISGHKAAAYLTDMEGQLLHEWSYTNYINWPSKGLQTHNDFWRRTFLYPNGDLLAIYESLGIIKLDKNSNLLWMHPGGFHHDLQVAYDGMIYALMREAKMNPEIHSTEPVLESYIAVLTPQGKIIRTISLYKAFKNSSYNGVLDRMAPYGDIFHTNTLEIFDGRHVDKSPLFKKGNALISSRVMDNIAIVDLKNEVVVWSMLGNWRSQHHPTLLDNGNILLFDNFHERNASKIIELDPLSKKTLWVYKAQPLHSFFSATCGSNQRLPNGNTLITESDNGRAFEVTPDKQIVWEFYNPNRAGKNNELVATLFELIRLDPEYLSKMNALP